MDPIEANKIVYAKIARQYSTIEPHYFSENQRKVKSRIMEIRKKTGPRLLDIGCGTGFIINLAKDIYDEIHGIDVSIEMLQMVDTSGGNIRLHNIEAENLPFENEYFDVVTAYAVLHHFKDYKKVLKEAFKVLNKNGVLYIDLEPNKKYFDLVSRYKNSTDEKYPEIVRKEIRSVCHSKDKIEEEYGIDGNIANIAEYTKHVYGGIDAEEFKKTIQKIGFSNCEVVYDWYPGQGNVIHQQSEKDAEIIDNYLHGILPFSQYLYKYLCFIVVK
jgi:ubiquinone/menaquinone biosynthesis C-methylase UbiE